MIAVLGAGHWGTALATVLADASPNDKILFWGRTHYNKYLPDLKLPDNIEFSTNLIDVLNQATDLLLTIPSSAFTDVIKTIIPHINPSITRIAWATKGLDAKTGRFFSEIISSLLGPNIPIAILSGPSFALEVIKKLPTSIVLASKNTKEDQEFSKYLIKKMHSKYFRIYTCTDVIGVQLGGVLKNILAVASGICDGLGFGANMRAALVTRGLAEGLRLIESLGGKRQTLMGLSGAGDIFLSCSDNQSRNRRFGLLLSTGITIEQAKSQIGQAIEALNNIEHIHHLALNHNVSMPIVLAMRQIITNNLSLKQAIENLLERPAEVEWL